MPQEPQTLAQRVRAKYPGAYDDLSDEDLDAKVRAKYPGVYDDIPSTQADPTEGRSALSRGVGGVLTGSGIADIPGFIGTALTQNPLTTAKELVKGTVAPLARLGNVGDAFRKAGITGAANEIAASIPILGPAAEQASERMKSGDIAGGVGEVIGMIGTAAPQSMLKAAGLAGKGVSKVAPNLAPGLERAAQSKIVDVMAPKVGGNKVRFGNMAADVAPTIAAEPGMGAFSRQGLAVKIGDKLTEHESLLDAAQDARNVGHAFPTAPVIKSLQASIDRLTAEAVEGSKPTPAMTGSSPSGLIKMPEAVPVGSDVVPTPNRGRVAVLQKAINELKQLGPVARYDSLKTIRQSYDKVARAGGKYSPAITPDFLKNAENAAGAADVTGALRDALASFDPATAKANKGYSLWRKADDVMKAVEEVERTRPTVGRKIMARGVGAMTGQAAAGGWGAAAGLFLGPVIDAALNSGPTFQIVLARGMDDLAKALRKGDVDLSAKTIKRLQMLAVSAKAGSKGREETPTQEGQ